MPFAPSTSALQSVPSISVGRSTGHFADLVGGRDRDQQDGSSEDEYDSDVEVQIKRKSLCLTDFGRASLL
jgi:hypothetical protein